MGKSIYYINPREDLPGYFGLEVLEQCGLGRHALIADLTTATLAAVTPKHWQVQITDERISHVDLDSDAELVAITGKVSQRKGMIRLARHFHERGKQVIIGGPYATLNPEEMRPHCDILFRGEIESLAGEFFSDLEAGNPCEDYFGGPVDLAHSPLPDWKNNPFRQTTAGCIQTSRGCPFTCEFCDVIEYVGRKQRHKPVDQVLQEVEALSRLGYRSIFLADDNFTVYRSRAKELLTALADWNARHKDKQMSYSTQVSIDAARDAELLELCAEARLRYVFIGIETPNQESLKETKKRQNKGIDLVQAIQEFLAHGIAVVGGIIVGFDADGPDIFRIQEDFIQSLPVPIVTAGALVAPSRTPLYNRLKQEGRVLAGDYLGAGSVWDTNIVPKQMSREALIEGLRTMCQRLYTPEAFEWRVMNFIHDYRSQVADKRPLPNRMPIPPPVKAVMQRLAGLGKEEKKMLQRVSHALAIQPVDIQMYVKRDILRYAQVRYLYAQAQTWHDGVSSTEQEEALATHPA